MHVETGMTEAVDAQCDTKSMGGVKMGWMKNNHGGETLTVLLIPPWELGKRAMKINNDTDRQLKWKDTHV